MSDLQSPWLGEMERNLAKAFSQAQREGAVLQIDEVDAYLRDRRNAERSWEVSQTTEFLTQLESFDGIFRSEEHTSELQSLMRISYAVFCLKKNNKHTNKTEQTDNKGDI